MTVHSQEAQALTFTSIILSASSCFVLIYVLIKCVGKKSRQESSINGDNSNYDYKKVSVEEGVVVAEVATEVLSGNANGLDIPDKVGDKPSSNELRRHKSYDAPQSFEQYDPKSPRKSLPLDLSIKINPDIVKNPVLNIQTIENEGSGNSDSGNSTYAKVKHVPKREECAYSVVDINNSTENYDVVNGDLVRKVTPSSLVDEKETISVNSELVHNPSVASSLYAKVDTSLVNKRVEEVQENSGNSGYYACVSDKNKPVESVIEIQENSGNSGYYESCGPVDIEKTVTEQSKLAQNVEETYVSIQNDSSTKTETEVLKNTKENNRTKKHSKDKLKHDKKREDKRLSKEEKKLSKEEKKHSKDDKKHSKDDKKHSKDEKRHSKEEKFEHLSKSSSNENSPSVTSRFSRVNPFKLSKKHKHSVDSDNDNNTSTLESNKSSSLPREKIPNSCVEIINKGGEELDPPPLPSVDKLLHLTEHRRARRTASSPDGMGSSPEITPSSSPRSPADINLLPTSTSFSFVKRDSSNDGGSLSVEPSVVEDDLQQDDRYSKVDNDVRKLLTPTNSQNNPAPPSNTKSHSSSPVKVLAYAKVNNAKLKKSSEAELLGKELNKRDSSLSSDHDYADIAWKDGGEISITQVTKTTNTMQDEYATVDVMKKHRDRATQELYSSIDWNSKTKKNYDDAYTENEAETEPIESTVIYDGNYRIIPDVVSEVKGYEISVTSSSHNESGAYESIETYERSTFF